MHTHTQTRTRTHTHTPITRSAFGRSLDPGKNITKPETSYTFCTGAVENAEFCLIWGFQGTLPPKFQYIRGFMQYHYMGSYFLHTTNDDNF